MPGDMSGAIASQTGASGGLWTHTPVDWRGNETGQAPPGPAGWPTNASAAIPPGGGTASVGVAPAPTITVQAVTGITTTAAVINWTVNPSSTSVVEYGTTVAYGSAAAPNVGAGVRTQPLSGLTTVTLYHYRIGATANGQTTYTSDRTFTTV
jgi:hypothetical protein